MSNETLHKQIKVNKIAPLYLLSGTERFLVEQTKNKIISSVLSDEEIDFNLSIFDMGEVPIETAVDDAETLPFLGEKRVVVITEPVFLTSQKDKSKIEHDLSKFQQYVEDPSPDTVMIIDAPYEKLDERKKIVKLLKKNGEVFHAKEMDSRSILNWVEERFQSHQVVISDSAKERLVQLIGSKLMMLANEIDKMCLYVGEGGIIDDDIVLKLVARTLEQNIFVLIDKVVQRNLSDTLKIYYDLLEQKEEPIKILSLLSTQFRLIYQVKLLAKRGYGQNQIAGNLKVHPFRVKLAAGQGQHFPEEELLKIINELAEADYKMKSGKMDKVLLLELFFIHLNKPKQVGAF